MGNWFNSAKAHDESKKKHGANYMNKKYDDPTKNDSYIKMKYHETCARRTRIKKRMLTTKEKQGIYKECDYDYLGKRK